MEMMYVGNNVMSIMSEDRVIGDIWLRRIDQDYDGGEAIPELESFRYLIDEDEEQTMMMHLPTPLLNPQTK